MTHAVVVCPKQWLVATGMLVLVTDGDMCAGRIFVVHGTQPNAQYCVLGVRRCVLSM